MRLISAEPARDLGCGGPPVPATVTARVREVEVGEGAKLKELGTLLGGGVVVVAGDGIEAVRSIAAIPETDTGRCLAKVLGST